MKRAICHEAGHAITALYLGFYVQKIAVCKGLLITWVDLDSPQKSLHERCIVLAGGIAAEQFLYKDKEYDREAARDDQRKISERGGGRIETYVQAAIDIIRSNEQPFGELQERLRCRWAVERAEAQWESDPDSFEVLSGQEIKKIWGTPENNV
jgi:hypothetical protein